MSEWRPSDYTRQPEQPAPVEQEPAGPWMEKRDDFLHFYGGWTPEQEGLTRVRIFTRPDCPPAIVFDQLEESIPHLHQMIDRLAPEIGFRWFPERSEHPQPFMTILHLPANEFGTDQWKSVRFPSFKPRREYIGGRERLKLATPDREAGFKQIPPERMAKLIGVEEMASTEPWQAEPNYPYLGMGDIDWAGEDTA